MNRAKLKFDLFLVGGILFAGCLLAFCIFFFSQKGDFVQVRVAGKVTATYSLFANGAYEINGISGKNRLVIQNGEAWMEDASCPDKLCMQMGHISKTGQSVICLPNQVTVEITSRESEEKTSDSVDMIAG